MVTVDKENKRSLYNLVWRWHFYAGLFTAPFIIILAITGGLYLFQTQIDEMLYSKLLNIKTEQKEYIASDNMVKFALEQFPGSKPLAYIPPAKETRSALVRLQTPDWKQMLVAVNPYSGEVIGSIDFRDRFMWLIRTIHGTLTVGKPGKALMELSASWAMVLIITGLYMWWPKQMNRTGSKIFGVILPRLRTKGRMFWKDIHSITGLWISLIMIFLILSGLP